MAMGRLVTELHHVYPILVLTIVLAACIHFVWLIAKTRRHYKQLKEFGGPKPQSVLGNLADKTFDRDETVMISKNGGRHSLAIVDSWVKAFPRLRKIWLSPLWVGLHFAHPDYLKSIVGTAERKEASVMRLLKPFIGEGLITSEGQRWARNRRLLTPAFHFTILKSYTKVFRESAAVMVDKWHGHLEGGGSISVDMFSDVPLLTLDSMLKCAFSYRSDCQILREEHPYLKAIASMSAHITERYRYPLFQNDILYYLSPAGYRFRKACRIAHSFSQEVIESRRKKKQLGPVRSSKYLDFLDMLLEARDEDGRGLTDEEIQMEVDTFLFAGHDTTASALSFIFYNLARHPEYQHKCRVEIEKVLDGVDEITSEHLGQLEFLNMCIKESLRLHSPVTNIFRRTSKKTTFHDGRTAPAGMTCILSLQANHHNEEVWEKPLEYDPYRFTREESDRRSPYAFIPFSAGPRNCIGQRFAMMELQVVCATILRSFLLEVDTSKPVFPISTVVLHTTHGLWLKVTPISHNVGLVSNLKRVP